jgi:hypothetical protein
MKTIDIARSYLGKKEKPNNSGFEDPAFETDMTNEGWERGWAWCCVFQKLIFKKAFPDRAKEFDKLFTPGAVATFNNFKKAKYTILDKPFVGALVIYRHYENGVAHPWQGHAALVSQIGNGLEYWSIDGNTSASGSRNGDRVIERKKSCEFKNTGLNAIGFIQII